ncbi:MAG: threonylcarbamoyl-AMP synthase [Verrucomicrobia bacterium]|nr:threonylcarbamoyl-AMP synthase [Verrucomicrobiota bacterium]
MNSETPMSTDCQVLPTSTQDSSDVAVREAVRLLRAGQIVALPTETVYGLAGNAFSAKAVERIFAAKGRPSHNPIIVHVANLEMARTCVSHWPPLAERLAAAFWPGPLSLVLPRSSLIPDIVTAGGSTVGLRWPRHPVMEAVIRGCGFPLAAPSANLSGQISPTTAEHVRKSFGGKLRLVIDGGAAPIGIESTVLDLTAAPPRILRPGMIHAESLASVAGELDFGPARGGGHLRSPGLLEKHYAPKARLAVWSWSDDAGLKSQIASLKFEIRRAHVIAHTNIPSDAGYGQICVLPRNSEAFASALYAEWHKADEAGAELIVVEKPPAGPEWQAIADRLARAADQF